MRTATNTMGKYCQKRNDNVMVVMTLMEMTMSDNE